MTAPLKKITIIKMNHLEEEVWRYPGRVLTRNAHSILVEARFNHSDVDIHGVLLRENDRFLERYYDDRWYNIMEARDRDDGFLKGWYCNVTRPARITGDRVFYVDLALDLLAYPDGRFLILDQDEFETLDLDPETRQKALAGLEALVMIADKGGFAEEMRF